jgi:hypothetical protein
MARMGYVVILLLVLTRVPGSPEAQNSKPAANGDSISFTDDGNHLLRACKAMLRQGGNDPIDTFAMDFALGLNCAGYINGITDLNSIYRKFFSEAGFGENAGLFCLPNDGIETGQAVRIVVKYLEANPEILHHSRRTLAVEALMKAFPCIEADPQSKDR